MPSEKPTFGCGTFLPGFGPFNTPSYGFGDTVDSGADSGEPPVDPPIDNDEPANPPGGGGTGGGGDTGPGTGGGSPGTPGPGTPGVGGPTTGGPGNNNKCVCRPDGPPILISQFDEPNGFTVTSKYKIKQKCESVPVPLLGQDTSQEAVDDLVDSIASNGSTIVDVRPYNGDEDCESPGPTLDGSLNCGGNCPDVLIYIRWNRPIITVPGGPFVDAGGGLIDQGEVDGDNGGGGSEPPIIIKQKDIVPNAGGGLIDQGEVDEQTPIEDTGTETFNPNSGGGITTFEEFDESDIDSYVFENNNEIDLSNPFFKDVLLKDNEGGLQDPDIIINTTPTKGTLVPNTASNGTLFKDMIDSNLLYVLTKNRTFGDWDSTKVAAITPQLIYDNLRQEVLNALLRIKTHEGNPINILQIYSLIGSRVIDGSIGSFTFGMIEALANGSANKETYKITPSPFQSVNEMFALHLIENSMVGLDPTQYEDDKMAKIFPLWKILSSDIDKFIPICINEEEMRLYVKDDNTFIQNEPLIIRDGDFACVHCGSNSEKLFTKSEIDHTFTIPEVTRERVVSLLGEDPARLLEVSALETSNIEYNYSLSSPRQNFYFLSCVLSSMDSNISDKSMLLKKTRARFELVDTTTDSGLSAVNEYIKYKVNHRTFLLDDEDVMLDYIQGTSSIYLTQIDVTTDSAKENKTIPLLTRQYPWYILVCPTNRPDLNVFNSKSRLVDLSPSGMVRRQLRCLPSIAPDLNKQQSNKFVRMQTDGIDAVNVIGENDPQTRIMKIYSDDALFQQTYIKNNELMSAQQFTPNRNKTGLRVIKEIINELDDNYYLGLNGLGKTLTEFDVFSRMSQKQFSKLTKTENFNLIKDSINKGLIRGVKIIRPIGNSNSQLSFTKSQLYRRKASAPTDNYLPKKATQEQVIITPPTEEGLSTFGPVL